MKARSPAEAKRLLDTNACIAALRDAQSGAARRLAHETPARVVLCAVARAELVYGACKSQQRAATLEKLRRFLDAFYSYPLDDQAVDIAGRVRADLAAAGAPIGPHDVMIAAIALAHSLTLVTHNIREFARAPGLSLADWT